MKEYYHYYKARIDSKFIAIPDCIEKFQLLHDYRNICTGEYNQAMEHALIDLNSKLLKLADKQECIKSALNSEAAK